MLGTVSIAAAFAFLITVQAASVELARDDSEVSDTTTTLSRHSLKFRNQFPYLWSAAIHHPDQTTDVRQDHAQTQQKESLWLCHEQFSLRCS
uniref:Putative secreted protein n=1 Tax=Amblyomma cajennense TaxID=34607 RepID=A0A023FBI3_AMBCJ